MKRELTFMKYLHCAIHYTMYFNICHLTVNSIGIIIPIILQMRKLMFVDNKTHLFSQTALTESLSWIWGV